MTDNKIQIAGKTIDFGSVMNAALNETTSNLNTMMLDGENEQYLFQYFEVCVWKRILKLCSTETGKCASQQEIIDALLRNGLDASLIVRQGNHIDVIMPNRCYSIYEKGTNDRIYKQFFSAVPFLQTRQCNVYACHIEDMSAETFVEVLSDFDRLIPEMETRSLDVITKLKKAMLQRKQAILARQMLEQMIQSLIKEHISPLGLKASYDICGDKVKIKVSQHKSAEFEVPVTELAEKLSDTKEIVDSLVPDNDVDCRFDPFMHKMMFSTFKNRF